MPALRRDRPAALARCRAARWNCYACRYQFSVTAGTLFHGSHLPVWKWLVAVRLMMEGDGVSANELRNLLGGSYKTWWFTTHRIRVAIGGSVGAMDSARARRHRRNRYRMAYVNEQRWRKQHGDNPAVFGSASPPCSRARASRTRS